MKTVEGQIVGLHIKGNIAIIQLLHGYQDTAAPDPNCPADPQRR